MGMKSKIRSGTITETTPASISLFESMKKLCEGETQGSDDAENNLEEDISDIESRKLANLYHIPTTISDSLSFCLKKVHTIQVSISSLDKNAIITLLLFIIILQYISYQRNIGPFTIDNVEVARIRIEINTIGQKLDQVVVEMKETRHAILQIVELIHNNGNI